MSRKAQAATEFLSTYGWAFIILLGVLGGLSYFGAFDPGRFVTPSCSLDSKIGCPVFAVEYTASTPKYEFQVNFENLLDETVRIVDLKIQGVGGNESCHPILLENATGYDFCKPAGFMDQDDVYSNCGVPIPTYGSEDIFFTYENVGVGCNFTNSGLYEPREGRKLSFEIDVVYLKGRSTKPIVSAGKLTSIVNFN